MSEIKADCGPPLDNGQMNPALFLYMDKNGHCDTQRMVRALESGFRKIWGSLRSGYQPVEIIDYRGDDRQDMVKVVLRVDRLNRIGEKLWEGSELRDEIENLRRQNKGLRTQIKKLKASNPPR